MEGSFEGRSARGGPPFSLEAGKELGLLEDFFRFEFGGDRNLNVL